ncbi:histone acetylation protein-domain-containing protein [Butyriboletus roseoflavus]|nr:histone acetylation protein-domain-containing protein [Butyriboletus roseoflavus]
MNLRDALLQGLASLPGTRQFHIHVLVSSPRKHSNLYPFAAPRPKTFLQDILVLLSEQPTPDSPRVLVSAIEASLYHVPSTSSAVLYVSKVDSTGQAKAPSPTPALVRAFLTYYVDPTTRPLPVAHVWVHLFARAQNQYLFPNSAEFPGKYPLTDVKLCAWWKRQFGIVAHDVAARVGQQGARIRLFYLLPGLGELEASHALERVYASTSGTSVPWSYGHPYSQTHVPLPCSPIGRGEKLTHIGHVVPWFDDDPKARFLDEIAYTTDAEGVKSPERKRPRSNHAIQRPEEDAEGGSDKKEASSSTKSEHTAFKKVSIEEFWERMSFRQECIAGAVTGFFVMATSSPTPTPHSEFSPLAPLPGQVSSQMMKRVLTSLMTGHEFPSVERAVWSTRVLEEAIKGLCDGLKIVQSGDIAQSPADDSHRRTPEPDGTASTLAAPETPPPRLINKKRTMDDVSPNPFAEPVASLETYNSCIYGSVAVSNPDEPRKGSIEAAGGDGKPAITVLTVRRKKRGKP